MSEADHNDFVHTGPDTIAGKYLRRFWQPVFRSEDLAQRQSVPIRIMSEDFTLYRGASGRPHVVASRCAHRGSQLSTGWVEGDSIRCMYHGWRYDGSGQCVEQPGEEEGFAAKIKVASYPAEEYLGLVFVYFGAGAPPPLRKHPDFERPGVLETGLPEYWPCNYFNRLDNACDVGHVTFTHRESALRARRAEQLAVRTVSSAETEYGIRTSVNVPGRPPFHTHFHMPNTNQTRSKARIEGSLKDAATLWVNRLFWRVPIDDENSVSFVIDWMPLTGDEAERYRERRRAARAQVRVSPNDLGQNVLAGKTRIRDLDPEMSTYYLFWIEDYVVQVGQGKIAARENEHLGRMDVGVILLRKIWQRELGNLAAGKPLKEWTTPTGLDE